MGWGDAKGSSKGGKGGKGAHREPKVWGKSQPISKKDIKSTGKHAKGRGGSGKGGAADGLDKWG